MAIVTLDDTNLTAIADAIRAKGVEGSFTPAQMAPAIASIISSDSNFELKYYSTTKASTAIMPNDFNEDSIILCGVTILKDGEYYSTSFFGYIPQILYNLYLNNAIPQFPDPITHTMMNGVYTGTLSTVSTFSMHGNGITRVDLNTPPAKNLNFYLRNGVDYDSSTNMLVGLINSGESAFEPTWTTDSLTNRQLHMVYV